MQETTKLWPDSLLNSDSPAGRLFREALQQAVSSISAANDVASLRRSATEIQALVHQLVEEVQAAEPMTQLISILNDLLTRRVIEVVSAETSLDGISWCWISLGSEGRQEQTLSSDQDNGIIFTSELAPDIVRTMLLPLAGRINDALDSCGFPLCTGQVMASNPQWCLSLLEWKERFRNWIFEGDPQALLNASIFFDLCPLHGARELADELTAWLAKEASTNSRFLFQMAANALQREVPLGFFGRISVEKEGSYRGTVDLKLNAATLFIDAARIYGLACGAHASNTAERFRLAIHAHRLHPDDVDQWINAFYFVQQLRLKNQQQGYRNGQEMHNHINPAKLSRADRSSLIDALRKAKALHHRLALDYPGSASI